MQDPAQAPALAKAPPQKVDETGRGADGFKPKYRHFHPNDRVWVRNPFDGDVVYQVADEFNQPFKYRLPAGKVSELPGGMIATLGVKSIVDQLIQNKGGDELAHMWDSNTRKRYEKDVILQVKSVTPKADSANPGEINLGARGDAPEADPEPQIEPEAAFPALNEQPKDDLPPQVAEGLDNVVASSLPAHNAEVDANNAGHKDE